MATYIALLRGINVGGNRIIAMAKLRAMFEAAGATDVTTYIQSGNVVFRHAARAAPKLAAQLEAQIAKATKLAVPVVLRTAAEWTAVTAQNPFPEATADQLHVGFLAVAPPADALASLDPKLHEPERCVIVGREIYMFLPNGIGRSKLVVAVLKLKPLAAATARNWRTVQKLAELSA
jgi:uncharacterized protein (DUF1697 family)